MPTFKAPMINLYSRDLPRAAVEAAKEHHGLRPEGEGRGIEIVLGETPPTTSLVTIG